VDLANGVVDRTSIIKQGVMISKYTSLGGFSERVKGPVTESMKRTIHKILVPEKKRVMVAQYENGK